MTIPEGVIIAFFAMLPGLIALIQNWGKTTAETAKVDAEAAEKFALLAEQRAEKVDTLWKRVDDLERKIARYERILDAWRAGIARLIKQVCEAGMEPVWQPSDESEVPEGEIPTRPRKPVGKEDYHV